MTPAIKVSLGAALEATEGNIARLSAEVTQQLVAQLVIFPWNPATIQLEVQCTSSDGVFVRVADGVNEFCARIELEPYATPVSTAVH